MRKKNVVKVIVLSLAVLSLAGCKTGTGRTQEVNTEVTSAEDKGEGDAVRETEEASKEEYVTYSMEPVTVEIDSAWTEYQGMEGVFVEGQEMNTLYRISAISALGSYGAEGFFDGMKDHLKTMEHVLEEPEALAEWTGADGTEGQVMSMLAMIGENHYLRQETVIIPDKNLVVSLAAEYTVEDKADEVKENLLHMRDSMMVQVGDQDYISGNTFIGGDGSELCLKDDGSFYYYQTQTDHSQYYYLGTYEAYYGQKAFDYLTGMEALGLTQEALEEAVAGNMDGYYVRDGGAGDMSRLMAEMGITETDSSADLYQVCKDTFYVFVLHNDQIIMEMGDVQEAGYDSVYMGYYIPEIKTLNFANTGSGNYNTWVYEGLTSELDIEPVAE